MFFAINCWGKDIIRAVLAKGKIGMEGYHTDIEIKQPIKNIAMRNIVIG